MSKIYYQAFAIASLASSIWAQVPTPSNSSTTLGSYALNSSVWEINDIPVCWEPLTNNQYPTEKGWVQTAVANSWGSHNLISFVGWNTCNPTDHGIRIQIADEAEAPHTIGLGNQIDGKPNGMVLNFEFQHWDPVCQNEREYCIEAIAVHEFGHALGFAHEQNRPDTPRQVCTQEPQGESGDFMIGAWDLASVMNYCNPAWDGNGHLSDGDVAALFVLYNRNLPLHSYHAGCSSSSLSRSPDCMAAIHRYCFLNNKGSAAYPQEVGPDELGFLCADATWYGDVAYDNLPGCSENTQSSACYSSTHQYCNSIGQPGIGMVQELGTGVAGVACVPFSWYNLIDITTLQSKHPGCSSADLTQQPACLSAVHRFCNDMGFVGGAITEVRPSEVEVGCVAAARYVVDKI